MAAESDRVRAILAVLAEPTRFRIIETLAIRPHTVGEVAAVLGALQPQTTKHLQALEAAGVVRIHRLGRRKLASLNRAALDEVADWLAGLSTATPDDVALARYADAVAATEARLSDEPGGHATVLHFRRTIPAPPAQVWEAWTDPRLLAQWWAPRHFEVERSRLDATPGGRVELRLREADGARYASAGTVSAAEPGRRLEFTLAPLGPDGEPLFDAVHELTLSGRTRCRLELTIRVADADAGTAPMIAGLEPGWTQLLDALADVVARPE
jgi:uncharacterized protein YndB with AHSA1/START domain/DNA-binding transcriptional ArsR family regulator